MNAKPRASPDSRDATETLLRAGVCAADPSPVMRHAPRACLLVGLLAVIGLWSAIGLGLRALEQSELAGASQALANLARSFEGHVERSLVNIDQVLTVLARSAARSGMPASLGDILGDQSRDDEIFEYVAVADTGGKVRASFGRLGASNVAGQAFFAAQQGRPDGGLYIGQPLPGSSPGAVTVPLSERILRADGTFGGIAFAAVSGEYFTRFYAGFDLGREGVVELTGLDGAVRARYVSGVDDRAPRTAAIQHIASLALRKAIEREPVGNFIEASPRDGVSRLHAYRVMERFPMVVTVGMTEAHVLTEFYQFRRRALSFGAVATVVILLLTAVLHRQSARLYETQREALEALANVRLNASVFEVSSDGIMITDADNRIVAVNPAFTEITRYARDEVIGRNPRFLSSGATPKETYSTMWQALQKDGRWEGEVVNRRKDGENYPEWLSINVVRDVEGNIANFVGVFSDATARRYDQRRLHFVVHYDPLTELPNRLLLFDRLKQAIAVARREESGVAVLFLDLDNFKAINDSHGHEVGDRYLQAVARRLRAALRERDTLARLGGDEFIVVVSEVANRAYAERVAAKCREALDEPFLIEGITLLGSLSVGISLYPDDGDDGQALITAADHAMYRDKAAGRDVRMGQRNSLH